MRFVMLFVLSISLSACASMFEADPINTQPVLNLPAPQPVKLERVHFNVLTKENAPTHFNVLEKDNQPPVFIALSPNDYKSLAINLRKIKAYIKYQDKLIRLYKGYYEAKNGRKNQN